ncbi:hypothetical protein L228DRAFT_271109 [Xylona heveae TC161]|uniref:Rhodopsin domain-containing protein n=1 Tax=Xylona heveae (strain CBS 132557 / TC161) TaxID=1328760 RepID=A0A165A0Q9_XYLHT|nr:hypothetical protein L228DRAFT_271109 [Xylona heveae TC161]KZF19790.1 hypothetical protein L228DRAFT_271109 [Xylona heveae TC161]
MEAGDNGPKIAVVMWVVTIVPLIFLALRVYCKWKLSKGIGWDDHVAIFSWVLFLVYTCLITAAVTKGVGKHLQYVKLDNLVTALKLTYIGEFVAIIACVLSKTSFAVTLLRIVTRQWQVMFLWFVIISMNLVMWLTAIFYFAQCKPTAALWDFSIQGKCWPAYVLTDIAIFAGAYSGLMDFLLALLPWTVIWKLQMRKREKVGVAIAMSLGIFASVTSFIKTSYLTNLGEQKDFTYYAGNILIWAAAETGATLVAASIPSLRILFIRIRSTRGGSGGQGYSDSYKLSENTKSTNSKRNPFSHGYRTSHSAAAERTKRDDQSDKSILGAAADDPQIKQTHEVTISYQKDPNDWEDTELGFQRR